MFRNVIICLTSASWWPGAVPFVEQHKGQKGWRSLKKEEWPVYKSCERLEILMVLPPNLKIGVLAMP